MRDLRACAGRGLLGELPAGRRVELRDGRRERVDGAGDDPVLRATAIALARALGQEVEKAKAKVDRR